MFRQVIAALGALIGLIAFPLVPQASADEGQTLLIDSGKVRCMVSANDVPRGGGPMVVCQRTDGLPFAQAAFSARKSGEPLMIAVKRGGGQFYFSVGSVPPGADTAVGEGQTLNLYGWTIENQGLRTKFKNDVSGHGFYVNQADINQF